MRISNQGVFVFFKDSGLRQIAWEFKRVPVYSWEFLRMLGNFQASHWIFKNFQDFFPIQYMILCGGGGGDTYFQEKIVLRKSSNCFDNEKKKFIQVGGSQCPDPSPQLLHRATARKSDLKNKAAEDTTVRSNDIPPPAGTGPLEVRETSLTVKQSTHFRECYTGLGSETRVVRILIIFSRPMLLFNHINGNSSCRDLLNDTAELSISRKIKIPYVPSPFQLHTQKRVQNSLKQGFPFYCALSKNR